MSEPEPPSAPQPPKSQSSPSAIALFVLSLMVLMCVAGGDCNKSPSPSSDPPAAPMSKNEQELRSWLKRDGETQEQEDQFVEGWKRAEQRAKQR